MRLRAFVLAGVLALAATACADEQPEDGSEETTEAGEAAPEEEEWDGDALVGDVQEALDEEEAADLALVAIFAEEPGHVVAVIGEDGPAPEEAGEIVAETCHEVPELEQVTVDPVQDEDEVVGPMDTPC